MYESSQYYTHRNREQQQQKEARQRRLQQQEDANKGECCSCFKEIAEFCPCICFCCLFGAMAT
jgi:hypothetical protein